MTRKHKIRTNTNEKVPKSAEQYNCKCGKKYKHASSLWNHKKNCENEGNQVVQQTQINPSIDNENLVNIDPLTLSIPYKFIFSRVSSCGYPS